MFLHQHGETKKKSREELLAQKRENEKKRYDKIKRNPALYAEYVRKNKEKYKRRKQEGKVVNIHNLPPRAQRALRKKWKEESKKAYLRRKESSKRKAAIQRYIDGNSPPESEMDEVALQNVNDLNQDEPERPACVPRCSRSDIRDCVIHENFTLLVCALSKFKIIPHKDTTNLLKSICCDINNPQCLLRNCNDCKYKKVQYLEFDNTKELYYWTWNNKTDDIVTNRTKKKIRVVKKEKITTQPKEAIKTYENMIDNFLKHSGRIVSQKQAIKQIKNDLKTNEALVHVDFSENYKCGYSNEIQAAHFGGSKPQISIHTSVLYFFDINKQERRQSFSTISSNLRHDAAAVWAHIEPILEYLHTNAPQITNLHILSDSATSQYRNYKVFFIMSTLKWTFPQLKCVTWNYSESGHGKGAPDGVGAVLKRTADAFINQGTDIPDFETFSKLLKKKLTNIIIKIITDDHILQKDPLLPSNFRPFKGTLQVHQAVWDHSKSSVALRKLSCTEHTCLTNATYCHHGKHLGFQFVKQIENTTESDSDNASNHSSNQTELVTVANLERCSIFSASCEMELPPELRRSVLDNILMEDPENKTESPLSSHIMNIFNSASDSSDYEIF
ncbi:hypothetical protein ACJJTC_007297 [Scirpophaga incertulas]